MRGLHSRVSVVIDKLAELSVGHGFKRLGVDDLDEELVFGDMQTVAFGAFHSDAGTHDFGKAVDVAVFHAEFLADFFAHMLGCGLCAQDDAGNREILRRVIAHLDRRIGDEKRIRRRGAEDVGFEILHDLNLTLRIARGHGNDGAAGHLAAHMSSETAREQTIAVRDLHRGFGAAADHGNAASEAITPVLQVVFRIAYNGSLTGRARGGMETLDLGAVDREQPERIRVTHILLDDKRKSLDVFQGFDGVRVQTRLVESLLVQRDVFVRMLDSPSQALHLQGFEFGARHALDFLLIVHRRFPFSTTQRQRQTSPLTL